MLTRLIAAAGTAAALLIAAPAAAQPASTGVPIPCERACMEGLAGKVLTALASLLGTLGPDRAESARTALEKLEDPFADQVLARAGWTSGAA